MYNPQKTVCFKCHKNPCECPAKREPTFSASNGSADTLLVIQTCDGHSYRGKSTREVALRIAQFILAAPEKATNQRPSDEEENTAAVGWG